MEKKQGMPCLHNKGSEIAYNENDQQNEQETAKENKHGRMFSHKMPVFQQHMVWFKVFALLYGYYSP